MYKLIAIDIDDTLLNDEHRISPGTKAALEEAVANGVTVTLATGRMYASARNVGAQLGLNVPLITYQGSLVKNATDGKVLYERSVPKEAVHFLFQYAEENGLHLQAYYDDKLYVKEKNDKSEAYAALSKIPYEVYPNFEELAEKPNTKLLMIDEPDKLDEVAADLRSKLGADVHITKSKPNFLEFIHAEGTKGHALQALADHFGYDISQTIAIGDSWNDKELIETAGLGVAMANAIEPLKKIANYITLSNNEDGVKHVVDKFIFARA
jgi:Cof subfamily protein (haloacid dehalogenase superfamily)